MRLYTGNPPRLMQFNRGFFLPPTKRSNHMALKYRPAADCFKVTDKFRAAHLLFADFQQERTDATKLVFYYWMFETYPQLYGNDDCGNMGFKLEFIPRSPTTVLDQHAPTELFPGLLV